MKRLLTFSLLMALCISLGAQNDIVSLLAENPDRATNNMHSYEFDPIVDTPAPKGFKPFYITHYGRHGSRYEQNSTFARNCQGAFAVLDSLGLLTETGKALRDDVEAIVEAHKGMEGSLTPRGAREHRMLAARMYERFPDVFKDKSRKEIDCFSSTNFRCIVSMTNFANSLQQKFPAGEFTFTSAEKYMSYINPSLRVRRPGEPEVQRPPYPAAMPPGAARPQQPRGYAPSPGMPGYDFSRFLRPLFTDMGAAMRVLGNPEPFVRAIFTTAGLCQLIDFMGIDIYHHFTPEELAYLWAQGNDNIYRMWGGSIENGDVIRYAIRPLLMDFVEKADAALEPGSHRAADLRFGHDTSILPLFALLGVDDLQHRHFRSNEAHLHNWYAFFQVPMATNCQMIFYRNNKGEVLTKILYNEKEILLEGIEPVSGPYYSWPELRAHFIYLCDKAAEPWTRAGIVN